ncbi:MAG: cyclase family protein [Caldilineaceae bacterium]|nr:cyclase family protein [Caldilineaceae bacterium]
MTERIIDLTRVIKPTNATAQRKFVVNIHDALEEIPGKVRPEGEWYVMSDVELMNHVGTHIETPFHCLKEGNDLSTTTLDQLIGDAVILDLSDAEAEGGVTLEQVQSAAEQAGGVKRGDIVFGRMGPTKYFSTAGLQWLVEQGIKLMGVDSGGVELTHDTTHANVNHLLLFRANIPLIENLTNLDQLTQPRVKVYALPVPVRGLDAFPLRVIAIERTA